MKIALILAVFFISRVSFAEDKKISLKDAIELVKSNNIEVKIESYKAMAAATDLTLIRGARLPQISTIAGVGPVTRTTGNYSGYEEDKNTWGAEWIATVEIKVPLYAWGRENDLKHAANLNTEINQLDVNKKQNEMIYKLKEAYYGWQYALSLNDFVSDTQKDLDDAIKALEGKRAKKEDILRLEVFKYQVEEKKVEIEKNIRLARMGVNFYVGNKYIFDQDTALGNERLWIELDQRDLKKFDYYLTLMNHDSPDLVKVAKGIEAKNDLLLSERKSELPVFGGLLKYDYAGTDQRTPQNNPFIYDPYNHHYFAAGVGFTWEIDFGIKKSKQDKLNVEISELRSKEYFAKEGLKILLDQAYMEVSDAEKSALALQKAYKSAKKWLANIESSVGLGLTPAKDIIDAYTTRALVYKDYYESLYHYQMAWAKLSQSVGVEVDPILSK